MCEPYLHQIGQLDAVPGFGIITAQDIIADTGTDMTVFPTAGHLASWAPPLPQVTSSAGQAQGQQRHRPRQPLTSAPPSARPPKRRPHPAPSSAPKYRRLSQAHAQEESPEAPSAEPSWSSTHALLSDPNAVYTDLGTGYYEQREPTSAAQIHSHVRAIERNGYKVTLEPIDPDPTDPGHPASRQSQLTRPVPEAAALRATGSCRLPSERPIRTSRS